MRNFKNHYFLSIIIFFLIFFVINSYLSSKEEFFKEKFKSSNINNYEVLILGPSSSMTGIAPKYLNKKAYNLSMPAQSLEEDIKIFNHIKKKKIFQLLCLEFIRIH